MRHFIIFLLLVLSAFNCLSQNISIGELEGFCNKNSWEQVNKGLLAKNWTYFESTSSKGSSYKTITWSFEKEYYSDEASGWFYLYTQDGIPSMVTYSVFNKKSYNLILHGMDSKGYKLTNSEIGENEIISTYANSNFVIEINTKRVEDSSSFDASVIKYSMSLFKKGGLLDSDNGNKKYYFSNGNVEMEYRLVNGEFSGPFTLYYENGGVKKTGTYLNGKKQGLFKEYDTDGNLVFEYYMKNDQKNGELKYFENQDLIQIDNYKNDLRNGSSIKYFYNEQTNRLYLERTGEYLDDLQHGQWISTLIYKDGERTDFSSYNYVKGDKQGAFYSIQGDSVVAGNYKNNKLHGNYRVYSDVTSVLLGTRIRTDTTKLNLISEGDYYENSKQGEWKNYDFTESVVSKGNYLDDKQTGVWEFFYTKWTDSIGQPLSYSNELFLKLNFKNGLKDGKSERFSYLEEQEVPCSDQQLQKDSDKPCTKMVYHKIKEVANYKSDQLDGSYELWGTDGGMVNGGFYSNGKKVSYWTERVIYENEYCYETGKYSNGLRQGEWNLTEKMGSKKIITLYFNKGLNHGSFTLWDKQGNVKQRSEFFQGKLKKLVFFDGKDSPGIQYEILDKESLGGFKILVTIYKEMDYAIKEYFVEGEQPSNPMIFEDYMFSKMKNEQAYQDGRYEFYYSDGTPYVIGEMLKEEPLGTWTWYLYEQKVKLILDYKNGYIVDETYLSFNGELFSGEFTYPNTDTQENEVRKIKDGKRHGKTTFLDINTNKVIKKENYKHGVLKQ